MQGQRDNPWVMVTGATGGIGKALIARLALRGQNVVATAREPERISTAPGPGRIQGVQLDLERPERMGAAVREVAEIVGGTGLSGLVNMAGIIVEGPLETIPPAELRRQFVINVVGPLALTQAALPMLKQARGRVVNIGAISASTLAHKRYANCEPCRRSATKPPRRARSSSPGREGRWRSPGGPPDAPQVHPAQARSGLAGRQPRENRRESHPQTNPVRPQPQGISRLLNELGYIRAAEIKKIGARSRSARARSKIGTSSTS